MASDPAQSFSAALNQGLGIFKSYRDEARQDEDRTFDKQLKLKMDGRAERAQAILDEQAGYKREEFKEWQGQAGNRKTIADQTVEAGRLANEATTKNNAWIDPLNKNTIKNSESDRAYKAGSLRNDTARVGLASRQLAMQEKEAAEQRRRNADREFTKLFVDAVKANDFNGIANNPVVATKAFNMISLAVGAPALSEAIQNPFGAWRNDPKKVAQVANFANINVGATARNRGYDPKGAKVVGMTTEKAATKDGKQDTFFKFAIEGRNPKTGKNEVFFAYKHPESFLDRSIVLQQNFDRINRNPAARVSLARAYEASAPEEFESAMQREYQIRENKIKLLTQQLNTPMLTGVSKQKVQQQIATLNEQLMKMENRDPTFMTNLVFNSVGRLSSM